MDSNDNTILDSPDTSSLPASSRALPAPPLPQQQSNQPPRPGAPILYQLVRGLVKPPSQTDPTTGVSRPVGRLNTLENFLGNFVYALGQGFQNEGRGPGSAIRGAGAAMGAPYQLAVQQYGMQQQNALTQSELQQRQAQTQHEQAATQLTQAQSRMMGTNVPLTLPNGQQVFVPASQMGNYLKGGYAADVRSQNQVPDAKKAILARLDTAARTNDTDGYNKALKELTDIENTKKGIDPVTGKILEGKTLSDFGVTGDLASLPVTTQNIQLANKASQLGGKNTIRQVVIQTDEGPQVLSLSSTTRPSITSTGGGARGASATGPVVRPITNASGNQVQPQYTSTTRTMREAAPKVLDLVDRTEKLVDQQAAQLGPASSRWNEFMSRKVGAPNPEFTKLLTNTDLLSTLLMRMHVGSRGGAEMMSHFKEIINAGRQSPENLKAALGEIRQYALTVQNEGKSTAPAGGKDFFSQYGGRAR